MARKSFTTLVLGVFLTAGIGAYGDTFKNKETGEIFYGFRTTKTSGVKTLVYNEAEKKLNPIDLSQYEVVMDAKGRRNSYVQILMTDPEVLLSTNISKTIADAIAKATNTGPLFVVIKIDNPGGRGENMKELCSTITKLDNCPIVAYVSGGPFGGAHSAAAAVAMACDKIYIAPTASMSAIGPFVNTLNSSNETDFIKTYSPDSLASYSVYLSTLAEAKHRPSLLAKAFLDKKLSLIEVTDTSGATSIIEKSSRQPTQTLVKTICEGIQPEPQDSEKTKSSEPSASVVHSQILNLTPTEALRLKLVDSIADSIQAVAADMGAADAAIATAPGIDTMVKQFVAAKRTVGQSLARINFLEERASTLEGQITTLEEQLRTTPEKRSKTRSANTSSYSRSRRSTYNNYDYYYDQQEPLMDTTTDQQTTQMGSPVVTNTSPLPSRRNPNRYRESETRTINEVPAAAMQTKQELYVVLNELVGEYQRTIATAQRWGGVLPPELSIQTLQSDMESAIALANSLNYRQ